MKSPLPRAVGTGPQSSQLRHRNQSTSSIHDIHLSSCPATCAEPLFAPMHPVVASTAEYAVKNQHLSVPLLLVLLGTAAAAHTPVHHSLLVTAVSWALIWMTIIFRTGIWSAAGSRSSKTTSWLAGCFLCLHHICDRAACDKEGVWSTKGFLPLLVVFLSHSDILSKNAALPAYISADEVQSDSSSSGWIKRPHTGSSRALAVATLSALVVLATRYRISSTTALGISSVLFAAVGFVLFENALKDSKDGSDTTRRGLMSANGTFMRRQSLQGAQREHQLACLRDVAGIMMLLGCIATYFFEPSISSSAISWQPVYRHFWGPWKSINYQRTVEQLLLTILINVLVNVLLYIMVCFQPAPL